MNCDFCEKPSDEFIRVGAGDSVFNLCNWECVGALAMTKAQQREASRDARVRQLEDEISDLNHTIDLLRAGISA